MHGYFVPSVLLITRVPRLPKRTSNAYQEIQSCSICMKNSWNTALKPSSCGTARGTCQILPLDWVLDVDLAIPKTQSFLLCHDSLLRWLTLAQGWRPNYPQNRTFWLSKMRRCSGPLAENEQYSTSIITWCQMWVFGFWPVRSILIKSCWQRSAGRSRNVLYTWLTSRGNSFHLQFLQPRPTSP